MLPSLSLSLRPPNIPSPEEDKACADTTLTQSRAPVTSLGLQISRMCDRRKTCNTPGAALSPTAFNHFPIPLAIIAEIVSSGHLKSDNNVLFGPSV